MMDELDNELLIALVEARPVLWDKNLDTYKDRIATRDAWDEISMELCPIYDQLDDSQKSMLAKEISRRWTNIRDASAKSRKKIQEYEMGVGGVGKKRPKRYVFHKQLKFLNRVNNEEGFYITFDESDEEIQESPSKTATSFVEASNTRRSAGALKKRGITEKPYLRKRQKPDLGLFKFKPNIKEVKQPNPFISFIEGMMPHLDKFDQNELLQFQIGVLQLISNITDQKRKAQQLLTTSSASVQLHSEPIQNSPASSPPPLHSFSATPTTPTSRDSLQGSSIEQLVSTAALQEATSSQQSQPGSSATNSTQQLSSLSIAAALQQPIKSEVKLLLRPS